MFITPRAKTIELNEIKPGRNVQFTNCNRENSTQKNIVINLTGDNVKIKSNQKSDHLFFIWLAESCRKNSIEHTLHKQDNHIHLSVKIHDLVRIQPLLSLTKMELSFYYNYSYSYSSLQDELNTEFERIFKMLRSGPVVAKQPIPINEYLRKRLIAIISNGVKPFSEDLASFFKKKSRYEETIRSLYRQINDQFMTIQELKSSVEETIYKCSYDCYGSLFDVLSDLNHEILAILVGYADEESFHKLCEQITAETKQNPPNFVPV